MVKGTRILRPPSLAWVCMFWAVAVTTTQAVPPANDLCDNPILIGCGDVVSGSTVEATVDTAPTCVTTGGSGGGAWYTMAGTGDEIVLTTCNVGSDYDTKIRVYQGSCAGLVCVTGNDDYTCSFSSLRSRVNWFSTNGVEYLILVHGYSASTGSYQLSVTCNAPPAPSVNDACASAVTVTEGAYVGDTRGSSPDGQSSCGNSNSSADVWYRFLATEDVLLRVQTCGSSYDSVVSIHTDCPGTTGGEIECDDNGCGSQSLAQVNVLAGETYYIRVAGAGGAAGPFTLNVQTFVPGEIFGPDVVYSDCTSTWRAGAVGTIQGYALGSNTCNVGDEDLLWLSSGTPGLGMNAYRISDGRLMQIGQSWVKTACCAAAGAGCGPACNGHGGNVLGAGCRDVYGASYNGGQGRLAPRSSINAYSGAYAGFTGATGDAIYRRLQIETDDLSSVIYPGAQFFIEGEYVGSDDAANGNGYNNASHKRVTVGADLSLAVTGVMNVGIPAIYAWRDHGLGAGVPDPSVEIRTVDVPAEGRFLVGSKVTNLGNNRWRYDYAIFNLNSDRCAGSFSVPRAPETTITNRGFHDVPSHSGEPYDNTDWASATNASSVDWNSPQAFAQNANSNALRWGTMYNFWFEADEPPSTARATIGLFKPGSPSSVTVLIQVPQSCRGDCLIDLKRDGRDLDGFVDCLLGDSADCACADANGSGGTDMSDLAPFTNLILTGNSCPQ